MLEALDPGAYDRQEVHGMGSVTLPTWLFIVLLALALWALIERLLVPGVRWYFRRTIRSRASCS